jgi:hypothetical protein
MSESYELPYLPDLARLEWLIHQLHRLAEESKLTLDDLARFDPDALADQPMALCRRVRLFESRWPVAAIWLAHQQSQSNPDFSSIRPGPERALIIAAEGIEVMFLDAAASALFRSLSNGERLWQAVDEALKIDPRFDFEAMLGAALRAGVFVATAGEGGSDRD